MKGKRKRSKRFNEIDLALRATCPHPYARQREHEPRPLVGWKPLSQKANAVWRMESQCVLCLQPIVAFSGPTGTPVWRSHRYLIEEVPW